jgi:ParB/RepB/Spo0J family partition protein|tara:strand:+ start:8245 stop:8748 length:504 start_codon:yes stop_codon:yes gene_type:complete
MQQDLKVEYVPVDALKPFVDNPREHSERNINDIKRSISRFGWTNPILVRREDNMIIAGHGRIEAATIEGLDTVPVIYLDMSDNDAKLYSITDNRTAETSEWDLLALKELTESLDADGVEIGDSGFELAELEALISLDEFEPVDFDMQSRLDEKTPVKCPGCGYEFTT